jgi:hypothetical protein
MQERFPRHVAQRILRFFHASGLCAPSDGKRGLGSGVLKALTACLRQGWPRAAWTLRAGKSFAGVYPCPDSVCLAGRSFTNSLG